MSRNWSLQYLNPLKEKFTDAFFEELPTEPGVYFFLDRGRSPLYVGKADNLKKRLRSYRRAKPGMVADHTLEMLELATQIRWEIHASGKEALLRESELLHALRPPFNIAGTWPANYLSLGIRLKEKDSRRCTDLSAIQFRLTHQRLEPGFRWFGCFKHRGKVKAGYTALLRLLYASVSAQERFHFPARICQASPPYEYETRIPSAWIGPLEEFLAGESTGLLELILARLLEKENLPPFMYGPIQTDIDGVREFFALGPHATRLVASQIGLKRRLVSQSAMDRHIVEVASRSLSC